jgi:hypothetical protein
VIRFSVLAIVALLPPFVLTAQQNAAQAPARSATKAVPANDIFSGNVTVFTSEWLTVVRKVPARPDEVRQFILDKDTKIEGKLRANARVSVQFKADQAGIHALRVVVRPDGKTAPNSGRPGSGR